jgi:hypothetical protein
MHPFRVARSARNAAAWNGEYRVERDRRRAVNGWVSKGCAYSSGFGIFRIGRGARNSNHHRVLKKFIETSAVPCAPSPAPSRTRSWPGSVVARDDHPLLVHEDWGRTSPLCFGLEARRRFHTEKAAARSTVNAQCSGERSRNILEDVMRKTITALVATASIAAAGIATPKPAEARCIGCWVWRRHCCRRHRRRDCVIGLRLRLWLSGVQLRLWLPGVQLRPRACLLWVRAATLLCAQVLSLLNHVTRLAGCSRYGEPSLFFECLHDVEAIRGHG